MCAECFVFLMLAVLGMRQMMPNGMKYEMCNVGAQSLGTTNYCIDYRQTVALHSFHPWFPLFFIVVYIPHLVKRCVLCTYTFAIRTADSRVNFNTNKPLQKRNPLSKVAVPNIDPKHHVEPLSGASKTSGGERFLL